MSWRIIRGDCDAPLVFHLFEITTAPSVDGLPASRLA